MLPVHPEQRYLLHSCAGHSTLGSFFNSGWVVKTTSSHCTSNQRPICWPETDIMSEKPRERLQAPGAEGGWAAEPSRPSWLFSLSKTLETQACCRYFHWVRGQGVHSSCKLPLPAPFILKKWQKHTGLPPCPPNGKVQQHQRCRAAPGHCCVLFTAYRQHFQLAGWTKLWLLPFFTPIFKEIKT